MVEDIRQLPDEDDETFLIRAERALLEPSVRADPDAVLSLLHEEFCEFGASGRRWDRSAIAAELSARPALDVETVDMTTVRVAPSVVLLTYVARTPERVSLRSSLWIRGGEGWRLFFHQGTPRP